MVIEEFKYYSVQNFKTKKNEYFQVLKKEDTQILMKQIPCGEQRKMNMEYVLQNAQNCPIVAELLQYFGYHKIGNYYFQNEKYILILIGKSTELQTKFTRTILGYTKIPKNEYDDARIFINTAIQVDSWEKKIKEKFKIINTIDELIGDSN